MIRQDSESRIFLEYGPVQMAIDAFIDGKAALSLCKAVALEVMDEFERVAAYLPELRGMRTFREPRAEFPAVLNKMITAVEAAGYPDLNTLGAVAGSFAEYAAETAARMGATRILVNNGGDIAVVNKESHPVRVGLPIAAGKAVIELNEAFPAGGICTSGAGGRSFSKGIASFVTVFAERASIADACATCIANKTDVEDEKIIRCLAEMLDSGTDIRGQYVTVKIGTLSAQKKAQAVLSGIEAAQKLYDAGIISGAVVGLDEIIAKIPESLPIVIE